MEPLLIRPHYAYAARWPDELRTFDTPTNAKDLREHGPLYSAYLERAQPRIVFRGVTIADWNHGVLYEVIAERRDGNPVLLRKTVTAYRGDTITHASQLADGFLAVIAVDYWENEPELASENPLREVARDVEPQERPRSSRPSLDRIATFAKDMQANHDAARDALEPKEALRAMVPRHALAERFHVDVQTADIWLRQARDAGLLAPSNRGRPRKRTTKGSEQ